MSENGGTPRTRSPRKGADINQRSGGGHQSNHSNSSAGGIKTLTSGTAAASGGGLFPSAASPTPNWRRGHLGGPSGAAGAQGTTGGTGSGGGGGSGVAGEWTVWFVMRAMNVVGWCKEQWMLWAAIATVIFAYYVPLLSSSHWVTSVCVGLVFFLSGTSFPFEELLRHAVSNRSGILLALVHVFVLSPALGLGLSTLPFLKGVPKSDMLLAGFLCVFCLPPSSASALVATGSAVGSESITLCVTAIGSLIGLVLSPALMRFIVSDTGSGKSVQSRDLGQFIGQFALIVLLPLVLGQICQFLAFHLMRTRHSHNGAGINTGGGMAAGVVDLKKQVLATAAYCSDACDTNQRNWRGRVRGLLYVIMLFLSYTIFCSLFTNPKMVAEKASWDAVVMIFLAETIGFLALCISGWLTTGLLPLSVEDRIAAFFSCIFKSEVLAIPLLSQVFVNSQNDLAIVVVPSLLYHLIQSCGGSLLCFPLRQWRNRQHCKPGTSLLPLRYIRVSKHHADLAAPSSVGSGVGVPIEMDSPHHHHGPPGTSPLPGGSPVMADHAETVPLKIGS